MSSHRLFGALVLALAAAATLQAQNRTPSGMPAPRLYIVTPAGAKAGGSAVVTLVGLNTEDAEKLVFSNAGIKAEAVPEPPPEIDPKTKKPKMGAPKATVAKFKVTVAAGTPLGNHDLRVVNKWGVSNPRVFHVGDLNEVEEKEPNNDVDGPGGKAQRVEVNSTINGNFSSGSDVDYYVFKATKGQRVVISCLASTVDSRSQPALEIWDTKGKNLGENVYYNGDDALTDFTAADDGDYLVRAFTHTYTLRPAVPGMPGGGTDQHYRLTISTTPWIDSAVPSVIEPGKTVNVTVWGRNLPGGKPDPDAKIDGVVLEKATISVTAPADGKGKMKFSGRVLPAGGFADGFELRVKNAAGSSNPFLLGIARAPVVVDTGDNDTPEKAQAVNLPCEIAGVVEKRSDADWYKFTAKKGEVWNIQVVSHQLGAPTYMAFSLRNPKGKGSDVYDTPIDTVTTMYPRRFFRRTEDPYGYRFVVPEDGEFQLLVSSRASGTAFGPRHTYAVRITKEEPDFQLAALGEEEYVPSVTTVPSGGSQAFNVVIGREGGFNAPVELSVTGLPAGVTCPPQVLAAGVRETTLSITAAAGAAEWAGAVKIIGTATVGGVKITREARPASIVWPVQPNNNTPTMTRLDSESWLCVRGKPVFTLDPSIDKADVLPGDKATIKVKVARVNPDAKAAIAVGVMQHQGRQGSEMPQNLRVANNQPVNIAPGAAEGTFAVTVGTDVPPGTYNIVFRGQTQVPYNKDPMSKTKPNTNAVGVSAPLRINVLPRSLATFTASNTNPTVKIGGQQELTVKVVRQHGFGGEFKVSLVIPPGIKGVEAADVTIPAGADEAKLVLKAPAGAMPGGRANLVVKAVAVWEGKTPVTHETKLNVNVVK